MKKIVSSIFCLFFCLLSPGSISTYSQGDEIQEWLDIGLKAKYSGETEKAMEYFAKALAKQESQAYNAENYAKIYYEFGRMYNGYAFDDPEKAIEYLEKAQEAVLKTDNRSLEAYIYFAIGLYYQNQDKDRRTQEYYEKSLALHTEMKNPRGIIIGTGDLGNVFLLRGDYDRAIRQYQAAIRLCQENEKEYGRFLPGFYHNTAICHNIMQDLSAALENEKMALHYLSKIRDKGHPSFLNYYNLLGHIYTDQGELDSAQVYLDKFQEVFTGEPKSRLVSNYHYQGILDMKKGDYERSFVSLKKAEEISRDIYGPRHQLRASIFNDMAHTYAAMEDWDQALAMTQKALMFNHESFADSNLRANPEFEGIKSNNYFVQDMINKVDFLNQKYRQSKEQKYLDLGLEAAQKAAALIDTTRETYNNENTLNFFGEQATKLYQVYLAILKDLIELNPSKDYMGEAFEVAEKSRAYQLMRALQEQEVKQDLIQNPLVAQEDSLYREITRLGNEVDKLKNDSLATEAQKRLLQDQKFALEAEREETLEKIRLQLPQYYQAKHKVRPPRLEEVQERLSSQEVLLEYLEGEEEMFILKISRSESKLSSIPWSEDQRERVKSLRKAILSKDRQGYTQAAFELHQDVFKGLNIEPSVKKVRIIPDGVLAYLPFSVLLAQTPDKEEGYKDFEYLLRKYAFSYHFSAAFAFLSPEKDLAKSSPQPEILAFAPSFAKAKNPPSLLSLNEINRKDLSPLPGSLEEVQKIQKHFRGNTFLREKANRNTFIEASKNSQILHLATHAIVNDQKPGLSRLVFAETDSGESSIYSYELQQMPIHAELVTLSACNTGMGSIQAGEGVMSLARSFAYAGCESTLMSLWAVSDVGTANFIPGFYEKLAQGKAKDVALQEAKLQYLDKSDDLGAAPFYWAGFVLNGETRPLRSTPQNGFWYGLLAASLLLSLGLFWGIRRRLRKV